MHRARFSLRLFDIVLVHHQSVAENGEKVVALINYDQVTLKTFFQEKEQISLQPANKRMEPIIVRSGSIGYGHSMWVGCEKAGYTLTNAQSLTGNQLDTSFMGIPQMMVAVEILDKSDNAIQITCEKMLNFH